MRDITLEDINFLIDLIKANEDWILERTRDYAYKYGYTKYTSTLKEAWRVSIEGLSNNLIDSLKKSKEIPSFGPDDDFKVNPISVFGVKEAKLHRKRGITLTMFLGLMKYYRQSYKDLILEKGMEEELKNYSSKFIDRYFDCIELGFVQEWTEHQKDTILEELQEKNREMTNEKNKYLTIFESLPNPVIFVNKKGEIENMNYSSAYIFDFSRSPGSVYYGKKRDFKMPSWLAEELESFKKAKRDDYTTEREISTVLGKRFFHIKMKKMLDISNKYTGTSVILNDYTERKEAELKLLESERRYQEAYETENFYKDLFTHDINNILQNLISTTELMEIYKSEGKLDRNFQELFHLIKDQVKRGKILVKNVRKLSQVENQGKLTKICLNNVLHGCLKYMKDTHKSRPIEIEIDSDNTHFFIIADDLLQDVFENLILNSIKYNDNEKVNIHIRISKDHLNKNNFVKVEFADNGIGIPDKKKKIIFQKGFRREKNTKGLGFGLSLVKKIMNKYNGKIFVENRVEEDYSKGTKFILLFPEY